jgi:hypothetical protein
MGNHQRQWRPRLFLLAIIQNVRGLSNYKYFGILFLPFKVCYGGLIEAQYRGGGANAPTGHHIVK